MRRRRFLVAGSAALAAFAGCTAPGDPNTTTTTTASGTPGVDETGSVPLSVSLSSSAPARHELAVRLVHVRRAPCHYQDPPCEVADERETLFERSPELSGGDSHSFEADLPLSEWVDTYVLAVAVDGGDERVFRGVEAGARPVVGPGQYDSADWVVRRTNDLTVTVVDDDGGISVGFGQ